MNAKALEVLAQRATRDVAREAFDKRYTAIKADMEERGIAGRLLDETVDKARDVFDETVAIVEDNPGIVGGTLAALALWLFRNPILAWIEPLLGRDCDEKEES